MAQFSAGQKLLAADLEALVDAWTTYTPSWAAVGTPTIGNGTLSGKYQAIGKTVHFRIGLTGGSTTTWGTAANQWTFGLPLAANYPGAAPFNQTLPIGSCYMLDASAGTSGHFWGPAMLTTSGSTTHVFTRYMPTGALTTLNNGSPFTPTTSDSFQITGTYEAA